MQLSKLALLIGVFIPAASANAAQPAIPMAAPANSCLPALGRLGATPNAAITVVDGAALNSPSDLRSLRRKAKDGQPIIVKGGDFSGKKFGDDDFSNLCFDGARFVGTRWSKSRLDGAAFVNSDLTGALFDRVSLRGILFRNSVLTRMDASGANLSYGQLDGGWDPSMAGLRLENAQMTGFKFECGSSSTDGCSFDRKQISLRGANLTNANLGTFSLWDANLVDVILNNTEIAFDQIPQYADADVQGPLRVKSGSRQVGLSPDAFTLAATLLRAPAKPDTECSDPATPLTQIFCQTGQSALRAQRDDIDRMYQSIANSTRPDGSAITVTAPSKAHDRYLASLRKCALKVEDKAIPCIADIMTKRRAVLVATLIKARPLEADVRALFVNVETPMLQNISREPRLASLTPLLIDSASTYLLAYRDDDNLLNARGISQPIGGTRCMYSFATANDAKPRKQKPSGPSFAAWSSGAEFAVEPFRTVKRKKVKKARKGKKAVRQTITVITTQPETVGEGCASTLKSGPLIRIPISENDFDRLWVESRAAG